MTRPFRLLYTSLRMSFLVKMWDYLSGVIFFLLLAAHLECLANSRDSIFYLIGKGLS